MTAATDPGPELDTRRIVIPVPVAFCILTALMVLTILWLVTP
jgi:hypothetical protein